MNIIKSEHIGKLHNDASDYESTTTTIQQVGTGPVSITGRTCVVAVMQKRGVVVALSGGVFLDTPECILHLVATVTKNVPDEQLLDVFTALYDDVVALRKRANA